MFPLTRKIFERLDGLVMLYSPFYVGMLYGHNEVVWKKWRRFLTTKK